MGCRKVLLLRVFLMSMILCRLLAAEGADKVPPHEDFSDPSGEPLGTYLIDPPPELQFWVIDLRRRISAVQKKETALAQGIKVPVICVFDVEDDGSISRLTFRKTSGDQDNDTCALEIIRKAAPFDRLPRRGPEIKRFAVEVGSRTIKIWQCG